MAASHTADPIRDLNNLLQRQPGGNINNDFKWSFIKEGPEHEALYHVTAVYQGVNIGVGHGPSKKAGKRSASVQALEYLRSWGEGSKYGK